MFADPVRTEDFFDREENLKLMKKRIEGLKKGYRQNVALLGPELMGKTSLLLRLLDEVGNDNEILPIYLAVRHEPLQAFADRFTQALLYYYFKKEDEKILENKDSLFKNAEAKLPQTIDAISKIPKLFGRKSRDHILSSLFDLLPVVSKESKRFCILILDEFQELSSFKVRSPFGMLGEKIMTQKEIMYIVVSSRIRRADEILSQDLSLLFGSFEVYSLEPFDSERSLAFVKKKLERFTISKPAMKFLVSITNGHPFYLDSFCRQVEGVVNTTGSKEADQSVVAKGISRGLFCPRSITYQYLNDLVDRSANGTAGQDLEILLAIADGNKKSSQIARIVSMSTAQTTRRLERLANSDIILRSGKVYDFSDPLLKWWIRSVYHQRDKTVGPIIEEKGEQDLQRELEELMSSYRKSTSIGMGERLRNVFGLFRNDVVSVAGKTQKLPKFNKVFVGTVRGQELPVVGSMRNGYWVADFVEKVLSENEVRAFLSKASGFRKKIAKKILVCLSGIDTDAGLLAKEEGIWVWRISDLNFVLGLYEQPRVF